MLKTKIIKDTALMNLAIIIGQIFKVLQGFLILKFLDPAAYGIWLSLDIVIKYSAYAHLGLEYGFSNRLPYYIGRNNSGRVREMQDTAYIGWTFLAFIFTMVILGYSFFSATSSLIFKWGLPVIAVLALSEQQIAYLGRWLTSGKKDFTTFSRMQVVRTIINFCLVIPLAYFFNVGGLMAGTMFTSIILAGIWWRITDFRFQRKFSWDALKELFGIGVPILLTSLGGLLIETVDRLLILNILGSEQLGYYGVTVLGGSFMYGILAQSGSAMMPHMVEDIGRNDDNPYCLKKYLIKPTLVFASASVLMILALQFIIPLIVTYWVPKYLPGLPAFFFFIPGYFFLSIILSAGNIMQVIYVTRKRLHLLVYFQAGAVLVEAVCGILFLKLGYGIAGVALSSTLAYAFYGVIVISLAAFHVMADKWEAARFLGEVFSFFLIEVALFFAFRWFGKFISGDNLIIQTVIQLTLCVIAGIPILFWLNRRIEIMKDISPFVTKIRARFFSPPGNAS